MGPRSAALAALIVAGAVEFTWAAQAERQLVISGRASPEIGYRLRVDFTTRLNDRACKFDDSVAGMLMPLVESHSYTPRIAGETHSLTVPLRRPGADDVCDWAPTAAFICVGARGAEADACRPLLVARSSGAAPPTTIDVECDPRNWSCTAPDGTDPVRQVEDFARAVVVNVGVKKGT